MSENRLNIIRDNQGLKEIESKPLPLSSRLARKQHMQATFERLWLLDPEQFDPLRNCLQRERLDRTWNLLTPCISPESKRVVDLGCGSGAFSRRLRDAGAEVDAVDIAENALKILKSHSIDHIHPMQDSLPLTKLDDQVYDVVVCLDVIAELLPVDYRLFFSELARLVKPDGFVLCSTSIDFTTEDGGQRFLQLAQSEFLIIDTLPSYHKLHIQLNHLFKKPTQYLHFIQNQEKRQLELQRQTGWRRQWFRLKTSSFFRLIWTPLSWIAFPFLSLLKNSRSFLLLLENISYFIWSEQSLTHLIFIAKRRPLFDSHASPPPMERPHKKEIWE